jgi:hypothetical protein
MREGGEVDMGRQKSDCETNRQALGRSMGKQENLKLPTHKRTDRQTACLGDKHGGCGKEDGQTGRLKD